jgi:hypothetical protein
MGALVSLPHWSAVVGTEAADLFTTAALQELLKAFVRHVDAASRLATWIQEFDPKKDSLQDLDRLLRMQARETKEAAARATKAPAHQPVRYTQQAAKTASNGCASRIPKPTRRNSSDRQQNRNNQTLPGFNARTTRAERDYVGLYQESALGWTRR